MNSELVRSIADLSNRWRNRFLLSKASSSPQHLRRGAQGEKLARRLLRRNGYKILYRNFKGRSGGEIDLVCRDRDTLVFVEVKTRTREDFGRPIDAVSRQKQRRISLGGLAWLRLLGDPEILFRFGVVEVVITEAGSSRIELIRHAFQVTPSGAHTVLYSFTGGADGGEPYKGVTLDGQGNLYGTAVTGGSGACEGGCGVAYKLTNSGGNWTQTVIHAFAGGNDGSGPGARVTVDGAGNVYGMTPTGGAY